ncbi:hypothetical protein G7Y79_00017g042480 [Physcia stellaris]|nr:hypothetical protein G7Y79_00017g042480 [Physcia stellaris]
MSEILNANPTVRNTSDLPSRRRETSPHSSKQRTLGLFSSTVPASAYSPDPFTPSTSSDEENSDDDDIVEPIDEQEIYALTTASFDYRPHRPRGSIDSSSPPTTPLPNPSTHPFRKPISANKPPTPDLIAPITDPEHPLTLGSLSVVNLEDIHLTPLFPPSSPSSASPPITVLTVYITPTITHCSLATVIGLGVRVRLEQALPSRFRVDVRIKEGTHSTAEGVNKQLGDKERVAAALENGTLMGVLRKMLKGCEGT